MVGLPEYGRRDAAMLAASINSGVRRLRRKPLLRVKRGYLQVAIIVNVKIRLERESKWAAQLRSLHGSEF